MDVKRIMVVGSGTMGAGIAAHLANAGRTVLLLDAVPTELTPAEASRGLTLSNPQVRNRLALAGLERLKTARPGALFSPAVVVEGQLVGLWTRTLKKDTVVITPTPFEEFSAAARRAVARAANRYGEFLGVSAVLL